MLFGLKSAEGEVAAAAARECGRRDLYCENLYESCMWASREGLGIGSLARRTSIGLLATRRTLP